MSGGTFLDLLMMIFGSGVTENTSLVISSHFPKSMVSSKVLSSLFGNAPLCIGMNYCNNCFKTVTYITQIVII